MQYFLVFSLFIGIGTSLSSGTSWGYGQSNGEVYGPADWNIAYPICAHQAQSPIDIDARSIQPKHFSDELDIDFHNDDGLVVGTLSNNGHAPTLTIDKSRGTAILTCGPANGVFVLEQFHFHFGCNNTEGSEHTVNRVSYPAEVHFVFYNHKYRSLRVAADKSDGLVVVGMFFKMSALGNNVLERFARKLNMIVYEGSAVTIGEDDRIFLEGFLPDIDDDTQYYTYKGSLTTPPCYQSVQWIVLEEKLPIGMLQLRAFRQLKATHGHKHGKMCDNFRPTQPLNGRTVFTTYKNF